MTTVYPNQIDDAVSVPIATSQVTNSLFNILRGAVIAVENELGINPSSTYTTVGDRLNAIQSTIDSLTTQINNIITTGAIVFAGDLSGDGISQTVIGLYNRPINNSAPTTGQSLGWDGSFWTPMSGNGYPIGSAGGDLSGTYPNPTIAKLNGVLVPPTPSTNQVLIANNATSLSYGLITDNSVSSSAAIAGTKINPSFGSQNITTTGSLTTPLVQTPAVDSASNLNIGTSATSIQIGSGMTITSNKIDTSTFGQRVKVISVNSDYNILASDYIITVDTLSLSNTIYMPSSPTDGDTYIIKDGTGGAFTHNITINGNGHNIDNNPTEPINVPSAAVALVFGNGQWNII